MDGTPFGRYRLIELLGRGGMGEVWRAFDTETDRSVAIKLLPRQLFENEDYQRRFRREAHAAAQLNNPHVIPIHNYGEIDNQLYVDMRLIEGRDLHAVLAGGALPPARAVHIIGQVASALHAAHQIGLLHRDIKPSNILLDADDFAYLIDFGIARLLDETRMTKSGNTFGTFQYIAPERLGAGAEEDARVDIYSLACVFYECLTGRPPFEGDTLAQLVTAHLSAPPPRPSHTCPGLPPQLDDVVACGMAKDPDQRYATTIALADAARDAIAGTAREASSAGAATAPAAAADMAPTLAPDTLPPTQSDATATQLDGTQAGCDQPTMPAISPAALAEDPSKGAADSAGSGTLQGVDHRGPRPCPCLGDRPGGSARHPAPGTQERPGRRAGPRVARAVGFRPGGRASTGHDHGHVHHGAHRADAAAASG